MSQQTADAKFWQNRLCILLGKFSLPLYLSHFFYADNLKYVLSADNIGNNEKYICFAVCTIITTLVVMISGRYAHKYGDKMFMKIKKLFVIEKI